MSLYSIKQQGGGGVQPWACALAVGKALKDFYTSLGDVTLTGANTVATLLDGPEKVVRYGNLTIGDGTIATTLTASNRCKGLTVICDSLTVKNNATLHMTGRGARVMTNDDPFFPFIDFKIPNQITLSSDRVSLAKALAMIKANGWALWDQGTFQSIVAALAGFDWAITQQGTVKLLDWSSPGGAGGAGKNNSPPGSTGGAGSNGGMGGGGSGSSNSSAWACSQKGGKGCPYSGGAGSGGVTAFGGYAGCNLYQGVATEWSGHGGPGGCAWNSEGAYPGGALNAQGYGGAGNPGGSTANGSTAASGYAASSGTGGKLVVICHGAITVQSGGKIEANGMSGGGHTSGDTTGGCGGGGSGGGHISLISPNAVSNSGTVQAVGGAGGSSPSFGAGGSGGAGSVVTKTFNDMGWS